METRFTKLNDNWNADPNAPVPEYALDRHSLWVRFRPNVYIYPQFSSCRFLGLEFTGCTRFRFTKVNDEGWYASDCRFSAKAPAWGEFYQVDGDFLEEEDKTPWVTTGLNSDQVKNFLFYFRDETLECSAHDWEMHGDPVDRYSYTEPFP